jgi:hypothetical protein
MMSVGKIAKRHPELLVAKIGPRVNGQKQLAYA